MQRLVFNSRQLADSSTIADNHITEMSRITLVIQLQGGGHSLDDPEACCDAACASASMEVVIQQVVCGEGAGDTGARGSADPMPPATSATVAAPHAHLMPLPRPGVYSEDSVHCKTCCKNTLNKPAHVLKGLRRQQHPADGNWWSDCSSAQPEDMHHEPQPGATRTGQFWRDAHC